MAAGAEGGLAPEPAAAHRGRPLLALVLRRLALSFGLLIAVSLMIFGGVEALPGDFATTYLGQSATPQAVENIRKELGLDQPATTRYFNWLGGAIQVSPVVDWITFSVTGTVVPSA